MDVQKGLDKKHKFGDTQLKIHIKKLQMVNATQQIIVMHVDPFLSVIMAIGFLCLIGCHCLIALYVAFSPAFQQHIQIAHPQQLPAEITEEEDLCYVCYESKPDSMLLPCGHLGLCITCIKQLCNADPRCPLCRETIKGVAKSNS
jgi:hypothetical protein